MTTLVIRFSSVGDIVLCGAVTGELAPVTFVTKPEYRSLAQALPGVVEVLCPPVDPLPKRADKIVDLHANWRSYRVRNQVQGPIYKIQRYDLTRRFRVWFKTRTRPPSVIDRYAKAARVDTPIRQWGTSKLGSNDALALIPFCRHQTKEWPTHKYVEIGNRYPGPVVILGGPNEQSKCTSIADKIGPKSTVLTPAGFSKVIDSMGNIRLALGGDTGLTHLCAAYQKPTLTLFGPTTKEDGFWPQAKHTRSHPLPCRPCSRFGGKRCPIGDHRCMTAITIDSVWKQLETMMI